MTEPPAYALEIAPEVRFIAAIADERRVCCCLCPVEHGREWGICQGFIEPGELLVLERYGERYRVRCPACAKARGYQPRLTAADNGRTAPA